MTASSSSLVAGVDYGSDAVRVSVHDARSGAHVTTASRRYPRWAEGAWCDPRLNRFRQHPLDHVETLEACFAEIAERIGPGAIRAIAIDATGSSPVPVDAHGVPLALLADFADDPDAMVWLWKDRSAAAEADEVDRVLSGADPDHTMYQGAYSSEWWWAKILRAVRTNPRIRRHAASWLEYSDWLSNMLVGADDVRRFARNACAAGHKALHVRRLGGMVPQRVLAVLDPHLAEVAETFRTPPVPAGTRVGTLSPRWAERLRLGEDVVVGMSSLDAHAGAVGAGISRGSLVKVMGTSTVDMFLTDEAAVHGRDLRRLCGIAEDSIVPGHLGGETSQAAFGDLLAWYRGLLTWPLRHLADRDPGAETDEDGTEELLAALEAEAVRREPSSITALDWINGRRYPDPDESASGALLGLRIGHDAVDVYRALVDAAVLGSRAIFEGLAEQGLRFDRVILVGGIAKRSPLICQSVADALEVDVEVCAADEVPAAGAAMYAACAAGLFADIPAAQAGMHGGIAARYRPSPDGVARMRDAFAAYRAAGRLAGELKDGAGVLPTRGGS